MKLQPKELSKRVFVFDNKTFDDQDDFILEEFKPNTPCEPCNTGGRIQFGAYIITNDPNSIGLCGNHLREIYSVILNDLDIIS